MTAAESNLPPTGVAGSDLERQAAKRLADALKERGRAVSIESVSVRISEGSGVAIHALLALAGGLIGLKWPLIGATIVLITTFSFYAERSLGLPLIGRLVPTRASQNVMSPPPGPAWRQDVEIVLTAGYDLPASYPTGEWLSRRFSGRLTTDRILLWAGMVPVFVALMLGAAGVDGFGPNLIQLIGSAILLSIVAAQVDRSRPTTPKPTRPTSKRLTTCSRSSMKRSTNPMVTRRSPSASSVPRPARRKVLPRSTKPSRTTFAPKMQPSSTS
ncbi:MAG: hypothetical protein IPK93_12070 [Solirubrobacterales bacterium]|nr:hypothetical protein [Solirubrobacterales bacterium]